MPVGWRPSSTESPWQYTRHGVDPVDAGRKSHLGSAGIGRAQIGPGKRRSFHRPRWTGVTRTRRPANSIRVSRDPGNEGGRR